MFNLYLIFFAFLYLGLGQDRTKWELAFVLVSSINIFYRAKHVLVSYVRIARYCYRMSSVCPPVTLVDCDHIHCDSRKVISRLIG